MSTTPASSSGDEQPDNHAEPAVEIQDDLSAGRAESNERTDPEAAEESPQDDLGDSATQEATRSGAFQDSLDGPDDGVDPLARPWSNNVVLATVAFNIALGTYAGIFWIRSVAEGALFATAIVGSTAGNFIKSRRLALNSHRLMMVLLFLKLFGPDVFRTFTVVGGHRVLYHYTRYQGLNAAERAKLRQSDAEKAERRRRDDD